MHTHARCADKNARPPVFKAFHPQTLPHWLIHPLLLILFFLLSTFGFSSFEKRQDFECWGFQLEINWKDLGCLVLRPSTLTLVLTGSFFLEGICTFDPDISAYITASAQYMLLHLLSCLRLCLFLVSWSRKAVKNWDLGCFSGVLGNGWLWGGTGRGCVRSRLWKGGGIIFTFLLCRLW